MNGRNGSNIYDIYGRKHTDWSLILSFITLILALLGVIYYTSEKMTDLKIENTNLKLRNELLQQERTLHAGPSGFK